MRNLGTLVRLHKWRIEESTRKLAELEALAGRFRSQITGITDALAREGALAANSVEAAASYSNFLSAETERRLNLERSLVELEPEIDRARERLVVAYRELKSYEITLERQRAHASRIRDRREQAVLDEIGNILHRARAVGDLA